MPKASRVALLSTARFAHLDEDLPSLVHELARLGVAAEVADWHDEAYDWSSVDLVVIRSPWDYTDQADHFLDVLERISAATELANPLAIVRVNIDKRYLALLAERGAPVVPTAVVVPGQEPAVPPGTTVVVKPTVSAGARDTERYGPEEAGAALVHIRRLLDEGRSVLVQPYVDAVDAHGETGLVYLGDRLSHAFRKGPLLRPGSTWVDGLYRKETIDERQATSVEQAVAEAVLDRVAELVPGRSRADLLYARVDLVPGPDGPMLMELELIEPSLFLETSRGAAARAAAAIAAHVRRAR